MPRHQHYEHVGAFYHPALGETFTPSTVTFMDVRAGTSIISRGARSAAVGQLQAMLNALKFRDSAGKALAVDSLFGPNTQAALRAAQSAIKARVPATVMLDGSLDKPTLAALEALQAGQPLPGEARTPAPNLVMPEPPSGVEPQAPWWKSPWVLGGGVLAVLSAVYVLSGDDKPKA
jgi:peptidoglycan hydrolase-like protein with peptidoglycan-binding domain